MRKADKTDINPVIELYKTVIDQIKDNEHNPEWIFGKYPKEEHITKAIENGELFVGFIDTKIVSSIIINHRRNEGYDKIQWNIETDDDNVYYIHLVAVNQEYKNRGIAKQMLQYTFKNAKENSIKSIRLSLNINNLMIENLYLKRGFEYVDTITTYIVDRGYKSFKIYEKII